ncbi:flavodoxin family protein [Clostridium saccharobutylicum]|uniref:Putative NADPH-dependent FMN reductase n=1 Tax=Clostridium saccharobutylicum DSM 13864 TaxID=1345695 RepID=U5MV74_CLOSA|nr:flavodoxin family protein [Clostridium saccharobutylicum]AGX43541.1 putative NADPH-dependent FMN reductase [Clostridium saccharobutylicum DSM 13864]AQR90839.1 iron-sulfur flavoprotein [Clostridium saccharobutylicum]AQS00743.1 iron-sulfur flavoprotein [Clostridium saccharobutylicum]AQS10405.1 iron-sulfur flavoprotein [Clostridium saccharobutylicum]AQS14726.1 iron-sulfur flavoprotein [Clostridium saccharobutylicum]
MKILGLTCGRKMSNSEILVKEALMGTEELGAEVELVRLNDLNIKPCTGCNACVVSLLGKSSSGECIIKDDDFAFIEEKIMECDGLILGSPIYEKGPTGLLKILADRMGPSHDVAFRLISKKNREEKGITTGTPVDERSFKTRVASLIAVGGSEWDNLALPLMHLSLISTHMDVVDKILVNWTGLPGSVAFNDDALAKARKSGRHVAKCLLEQTDRTLSDNKKKPEFIGEPGICPLCHSKLIEIRNEDKNYPAVCAVCGVKGTLNVINNKVKFEISEEDKVHSHVMLSGKFEHGDELNDIALKPNPKASELPKMLEKYKNYLSYSKPENK